MYMYIALPYCVYMYVCCLTQESQHAGKTGVVRAIAGKMASVYIYDDGHEVDIPTRYLEPTAPKKLDKVCLCRSWFIHACTVWCTCSYQ